MKERLTSRSIMQNASTASLCHSLQSFGKKIGGDVVVLKETEKATVADEIEGCKSTLESESKSSTYHQQWRTESKMEGK